MKLENSVVDGRKHRRADISGFFLRVFASAFSQISLGKAGTPFWWMVLSSSEGFRFSSCVFFISLLSLAGMSWLGYPGGERAVFKCHEMPSLKEKRFSYSSALAVEG